jgi:outer membrane protein
MKNVLWIAALTLLVGFGSQANAQTTQKIGFTNVDFILSQMPELKTIEAEVKTKEAQYQNLLQQKQKELQDKYAAYQKNAATMSDVIRTDTEKQLQNLQQSAQEFQQTAASDLQQKQQQLLAPVLDKIDKAIKDVAKENGYALIINSDISAQLSPVLLYTTEDYNISDLVFKKLGVTPKPATAAGTGASKAPATPAKPTGASTSTGATTAPKKN